MPLQRQGLKSTVHCMNHFTVEIIVGNNKTRRYVKDYVLDERRGYTVMWPLDERDCHNIID